MKRKLSRREFLRNAAGAAVGVTALNALAACTPAAAPAPAAPAAPAAGATAAPAAAAAPAGGGKPVKLSIWGGYPEMEPWYKKVTEAYTKEHPNVTFDIVTQELRSFEQKLSATIPSDTAADIIESSSYIVKFIEPGLIQPVPDAVAQWNNVAGRYDPAVLNELTYQGKQYGVPLFVGQTALYYNTDYFKEAGLTKPPETLDELLTYAQKLAKTDASGKLTRAGVGMRLFGAGSGVAEKFLFQLWPNGGDIIVQTPDGKWKNGYDNEAGRKTLQWYIDALYKYKVDDPNLKRDAEGFELGQSAMFMRESWVIADAKKNAPNLKFATAPVPKGAERWGHITQGISHYVPRSNKNADVAWDFIQFAQKPEFEQDLLRNVGWLPSRHDVDYQPVLKDIPEYAGFVFADPNYKAWVTPSQPFFDEVETKMAERLITLFTDKTLVDNPDGIAKAIKDMAAETDSILDKAGVLAK
jgi:multiple sugar transport system substrate-binding protein